MPRARHARGLPALCGSPAASKTRRRILDARGPERRCPFHEEQVSQLINFIMHGTDEELGGHRQRSAVPSRGANATPRANVVVDPVIRRSRHPASEAAQLYCPTCHSFDANVRARSRRLRTWRDMASKVRSTRITSARRRGDADCCSTWCPRTEVKPGAIMPPWLDTEAVSWTNRRSAASSRISSRWELA